MVVPDPVEHRVEGDETRRRRDPGLVHRRAAEAVEHRARPVDDRLATGKDGAHRCGQPLVERERDGVGVLGERRERDVERDGGVDEPGAVDVHPAVVPLRRVREALGLLDGEHRAPRPRVRVLEDEQDRPRLRDEAVHVRRVHPAVGLPERPRLEPRDLDDPHRLGGEDVRAGLEDDGVAALAEGEQRDEVRHAARRDPEPGGLAEQLRHPCAELVDRGVLADRRPAELGGAHRLPHLRGRNRAQVRAEVDHHVKPAAGAAPAARPCARHRRRPARR